MNKLIANDLIDEFSLLISFYRFLSGGSLPWNRKSINICLIVLIMVKREEKKECSFGVGMLRHINSRPNRCFVLLQVANDFDLQLILFLFRFDFIIKQNRNDFYMSIENTMICSFKLKNGNRCFLYQQARLIVWNRCTLS